MIKQKSNKIILFDIDHTIFDTILYRKNLYANLAKSLDYDIDEFSKIAIEEYALLRKKSHYLDPDPFLKNLLERSKKSVDFKKIEAAFWNKKLYESCVYPDVKNTFSYLNKIDIQIGIFSTGHLAHQNIKIESLREYLADNHIYISPNKLKIVKDTFTIYKENKTYIIDDYPEILQEVKKHHKDVFTVWIKRDNAYFDPKLPKNFKPDATITKLIQLIDIINTDK